MAKQTSVNLSPATGAAAILALRDFLVSSCGWVTIEESDGTTYESDVVTNGNQVTHGGTGAGGLNNNHAWFRIQEPGGVREWTFQRSTVNDTQWRVKVSALDGFTGGSPGATQTPSAADENVVHGSGTDASPGYATLFNTATFYRWHLVAWDVAENGVYPFIAFATNNSGSNGNSLTHIAQHSLKNSFPTLVGTASAPTEGEPDPCAYVCMYDINGGSFATGYWMTNNRALLPAQGWHAMNGSNGETEEHNHWSGCYFSGYSSSKLAPALTTYGAGPNQLSDLHTGVPVHVYSDPQFGWPIGWKGTLATLRWKATNYSYPDTLDVAGERYVYLNDMLVPFENGTTPLDGPAASVAYNGAWYFEKAIELGTPGVSTGGISMSAGAGSAPAGATTTYWQRVWDTGNLVWCYYQTTSTPNASPATGDTTPNHSGSVSNHQVLHVETS